MAPTPPYILACQNDSHLRELAGLEVVECKPTEGENAAGKDKDAGDTASFLVQLSDTVLFAEGGGQPSDTGALETPEQTVRVRHVERAEDGSVWHAVDVELPPGTKVTARVDWDRRRDHMAQHSGQHLITAVALRTIGYDTGSWSMGPYPQPSYLDLLGPKLTQEQIDQLERDVNDAILDDHAVTVRTYTSEELANLGDEVRFKERPSSEFPIRVVSIAALDDNMCCGTHVKRVSELQAVKLLKNDFLNKKQSQINRLQFVAGPRLLRCTGDLSTRSLALTAALGAAGDDQLDRVSQLQSASKKLQNEMKSVLTDLANLVGPNLVAQEEKEQSGIIVYHRREGSPQFMEALSKAIAAAASSEMRVFLTIGDETARGGGSGAFLLTGPAEGLDALNKVAIDTLGAKGGGKGKRFQGKIPEGSLTAKSLKEAHAGLREALKTISQ
ncbi:Alanyl-tRNA editing protein Aarsd1 [Hondaea fermentalgiana]|uniref:Alanyl-tRNA editing protein Aarsd1 n=1 Tax=Hondaea fermentalgiana TaxID=2315210 RepID=A0A2R5GNK8_9STRA|nr:Alanyl-tRNA editing protein Aarsd1 [Hondaea fermentalgiana]|eukprot:GBG29454.1 Alanyl-tRNA editing protein Aarsd1 [Hondaea fermentalgiana]